MFQQRTPGISEDEPAGAGISPENTAIQAFGHELRQLFESKNWEELGKHLQIPFVWLMDQPLLVPDALALAAGRLEGAKDLRISMLRILKSEKSPTTPHGSYTCSLSWLSADTFDQQEVQFDLHIGFERSDSNWHVAFLGVTRTISEEASFPQDDAAAPVAAEQKKSDQNVSGLPSGYVLVYVPAWLPQDALHLLADPRRGNDK
jgi:hypothetical protein